MKSKPVFRLVLVATGLCALPTWADGWPSWSPDTAVVPYYFVSDSMGNTLGVAGLAKHVGQANASVLGTALYSDKGSYVTYLSASNYQVGDFWLLGAENYQGKFVDYDYYLGANASNDSTAADRAIATGKEAITRFSFRYIVPWGHAAFRGARAALEPTRQIKGFSPDRSGITTIEFQPFHTSREINAIAGQDSDSTGLSLKLDWDNRNDVRNPTQGFRTRLDITYADENWGNDNDWLKYEYSSSGFWNLGGVDDLLDQQVFAFNFYIADTPTWNNCNTQTCQRPPEFDQVSLGGLYRLRSFSSGRFHGKSAINYSAEYRVLPKWQPLDDISVLNIYDIPWWQWVAFVDMGRVSDESRFSELHSDMQWSAGGAVRFQVEGIVVRAEMAWGSEESLFRVMVNQPF
ncbi:BamA/TamA family outer membrane protein [Vibrio vulnificus]